MMQLPGTLDFPERQNLLLGYKALVEGRYDQALEMLKPLEEAGIPEAGLYLGYLFRDGLGVTQDTNVALEHFQIATDAGSDVAALYAGRLSEKNGLLTNAARFYVVSAGRGNAAAAYAMFRLAERAVITIPEADKLGYLEQAYRAGHMYARRDRVKLMLRGKYGFLNRLKAIPMVFYGVVEMAFLLANDPESDKLH